jgi:hypothetical protein
MATRYHHGVKRIAWLFIAACSGGGGTTPQHPHGSGSSATAGAPAADHPSERECDALIDHVIDLSLAERRDKPSDAERAKLRDELHGDASCHKLSRDRYRCALAAKTTAEYQNCQVTRSSSTSNSSVAPGGMTPAAPRSP